MHRLERWHYAGVPVFGTVLISPKALRSLRDDEVSDQELLDALEFGSGIRARTDHTLIGREHNGVRLVIRTHPHLAGSAAVCINGYRVK